MRYSKFVLFFSLDKTQLKKNIHFSYKRPQQVFAYPNIFFFIVHQFKMSHLCGLSNNISFCNASSKLNRCEEDTVYQPPSILHARGIPDRENLPDVYGLVLYKQVKEIITDVHFLVHFSSKVFYY